MKLAMFIHDINFEIKAVGLGPFSFFNSCSNGFYVGKDIEIIDFEINGRRAQYDYNNYILEYNINLKNLQTAKIHLKYKEKPNTHNPITVKIPNFVSGFIFSS